MDLKKLTCWIFDMDGTLTIPVHDFQKIRESLAIPPTADILGWLDSLPPEESRAKHEQLEQIELELAHRTRPQPAIEPLLELLAQRGCRLGIITRNNLLNTKITLESAGIARFFPDESIRTRECAAPKPDPEAVHQLIDLWSADRNTTVICGDFKHDLNAGIAAGIHRIYFNSKPDDQWKELAELTVESWNELIDLL